MDGHASIPRLELSATRERPCRIRIEWQPRVVVVEAYAPKALKRLAWGCGKPEETYLDLSGPDTTLWLRGLAFDLSALEAQRLREVFEPLGLKIEQRRPRSAAISGPARSVTTPPDTTATTGTEVAS